METTVIVLWVYIVLLIGGGLLGYIKAKSKASIIASSVFAVPLILVRWLIGARLANRAPPASR